MVLTLPPAAVIWRAVASDWSSPKSVSLSPCTSSVGTVILLVTEAGETRRSRSMVCWLALPVVASSVYAWHAAAEKRPQGPTLAGRARPGLTGCCPLGAPPPPAALCPVPVVGWLASGATVLGLPEAADPDP